MQAADTFTGLGTLGGGDSQAVGVSADGAVVVGWAYTTGDAAYRAFRWTSSGDMRDLGTLGGTHSEAYGVSADGAVVVGGANTTGDAAERAFRWTSSGGMRDLGTLGGKHSEANGVSADGAVVVGGANTTGAAWRAFRWSQATAMQSVEAWLAGAGVALPAGWTLTEATGVNANGNVVVGYGGDSLGNTQAWLARVGPAGSGFLGDIPAFNATLSEAGSRAVQTGAARHDKSNTRMELAEAGACKDIGSARVGVGIGQAWARQGWSLGGNAKYDGQYLIAEVANGFGNGMEGSVTGYYGQFDTRLNRNYMNGANVDTSSGRPDARSTALRLRLDWKDVTKLGGFSLSPHAAYTWMETRLDAYTETGGGFPAQFAAAKWATNDLRIGAAAKTALSGATDLRLGLEAVHRLDDSTKGVNVTVPGAPLGGAIAGQQVKQNWARATLDVDHRLSSKVALTFGANAASSGGDANWGVTAGLRANF